MGLENATRALALLLVLLLGGATAWLGNAHRDLRVQLDELRRDNPRKDQWLPAVDVRSYDGSRHATLAAPPPGRKQVLYFHLPECPYCRASEPYVTQLRVAIEDQKAAADFLRVSLWPATGAPPAPLTGRSLVLADERMRKVFRVMRVPTLLVVNEKGRIEFAHVGVVTRDDIINLWAALQPRKAGSRPSPTKD